MEALGSQADFPGEDSQEGAKDRLLISMHFPGREELVWDSHWAC